MKHTSQFGARSHWTFGLFAFNRGIAKTIHGLRRAVTLALALGVMPALAQTSVNELASPPPDAKVWVITTDGGATRYGQVALWTDRSGAHWSRFSLSIRDFVTEIDEQNRFAADGSLQFLVIRGRTPHGDAAERYTVKDGAYTFTSPVDHGSGVAKPNLAYVAFGGTFDSLLVAIDAMLKSPSHSVDLLPSGSGSIVPLTTLEVSNGKEKRTLTAYAVTGFGLSPLPVWMDGTSFFAMVPDFIPMGWEKAGGALGKAQDDALAKQALALRRQIAKTPDGPIVFRDVKLYDSDAQLFRNAQTVVVKDGRIADVGPASKVRVPAGAKILDGTGKTLIPGLWDSHQHYDDDATGPLLLASGITSIRDPGNLPTESMARKKRIDDGELLGPRIVPSLLIDGPGPYAAEVGVIAHSLDEALADVNRAKNEGYFAIKLYGSIDPHWVQPMANLAHQLGLHVHGHLPHGMRPLDAVRAGYDEITHINFAMMQSMPQDVVEQSNTFVRVTGPGKYASDVDLQSTTMKDYLDELARRHIIIDPTLVTFEHSYVPDTGAYAPSDMPYVASLPPQFVRSLLTGAIEATPDLSRDRMRVSFAKLTALVEEFNKRHITILAGTDGPGFELIHELELYVQAGLSIEEALATATINPAKVYKLDRQTGSIAKGKLAELVLIDGDPAKQIGDLRQVELVMRDGKLMDAQELRTSLGISGPPKK
jgi:hypothetical protein